MIWATIMSAYCANTTWHFRPIHSTNILPTNEVRKLYKDSDGFIWICFVRFRVDSFPCLFC